MIYLAFIVKIRREYRRRNPLALRCIEAGFAAEAGPTRPLVYYFRFAVAAVAVAGLERGHFGCFLASASFH